MQKAYLFSIYPLFYMSIPAALKIIFLMTVNFLNMNNHRENLGGGKIRLFWGFSHLHYHLDNGLSSSIIHNENAFIVRILSQRDAFGAIIARKLHSHDEYLPGKKIAFIMRIWMRNRIRLCEVSLQVCDLRKDGSYKILSLCSFET